MTAPAGRVAGPAHGDSRACAPVTQDAPCNWIDHLMACLAPVTVDADVALRT